MTKSKNRLSKLYKQRILGLLIILIIALFGVKLLISSHAQSPYATVNASSGTLSSPALLNGDSSASSGKAVWFGSPPAIPKNGAYLGAWINPNMITGGGTGCTGSYTEPGCQEIAALPSFNQQNGKSVSILHVYAPVSYTHLTLPTIYSV